MWHEYSTTQECIEALAQAISRSVQKRLDVAETCVLAVSGGRSPIPLFARLSEMPLAWERVQVRLVDERYVPPDHPDSNEALVRKHLLTNNAAAAGFRGLYGNDGAITEAVAAANDDMRDRPVDVAILGMGNDGHMASLFPGATQLDAGLAPEAACYLHVSPPEAPHERISMSLAALKSCPELVLYISGQHKKRVLHEAEQQVDKNLPISFLMADPGVSLDVHWHP